MEQTTEPVHYTYFYYQLPDGETFKGDYSEIMDWLQDSEGTGEGEGEGGSPIDDDDNVYHTSSHERGFVHSANIGTIITALNIFVNVLLILLVLLRRSLRLQFVYQQIVNVALSDLAFSVTVDPFMVYFELQPWRLAHGYCVTLMLLDAALPFISLLALIGLNVDRLFFALNPGLYRCVFRRAPLRALALLLPWVVGLGLVLPLWLLTAVVWPRPGVCMYGITKQAAVTSSCLTLFIPSVVLVVLTVLVLVTIIGGMPQPRADHSAQSLPQTAMFPCGGAGPGGFGRAPPTHVMLLRHEGGGRRSPGPASVNLTRLDSQESTGSLGRGGEEESQEVRKAHRSLVMAVCVLNMLTVITQLPYGAISLLEPQCVEPECQSTIKLMQALSWLRSFTFSLHPLVFTLLTEARRTCCMLCRAGREGDAAARDAGTPSGTTKSDNIELASVHTSALHVLDKGSSIML